MAIALQQSSHNDTSKPPPGRGGLKRRTPLPVNDAELYALLIKCDFYLRNLCGHLPIGSDTRILRFSERFRALVYPTYNATIWLCELDDEFMAFALNTAHDDALAMPQVTLPARTTWSALQQQLVDRFEDDEHVRAVCAAAMASCTPAGDHSGVARAVLPEALRTLGCQITYDTPVDEDIMTVLADPRMCGDRLLFDCGAGHAAFAQLNESLSKLKRCDKPVHSEPFEESADMLMPFFFS